MIGHLSLFSGIGGLDLAAEWVEMRTVGQCEWADYPTKALEKHWPDVPRWRDTLLSLLKDGKQTLQDNAPADIAKVLWQEDREGVTGTLFVSKDGYSIALDRYWFADRVVTSEVAGVMAMRECSNGDNTLFVARGTVVNEGRNELFLGRDLTAVLDYKGLADYACEILAEQNDGTSFGTTVLPQGAARVIILAEIPGSLCQNPELLQLYVKSEDASLFYRLDSAPM